MPFCATRFDFDKFKSACTDVKQNIQSRLNQWTEYESQHDKLVNWLNECEANLKTYNVKASLEEKVQQLDRFKVCKAAHFFLFYSTPGNQTLVYQTRVFFSTKGAVETFTTVRIQLFRSIFSIFYVFIRMRI